MDAPRCLLRGRRKAAGSLIPLSSSREEGIQLGPTALAHLPTAAPWSDLRRPASNRRWPTAASPHSSSLPGFPVASGESRVSQANPSRDPVEDTATHPSPSRILIAADDTHLRIASARILAHSGYVVETAPDGLAAWRTLMPGHFDLLITDYEMPHLTGLELARRILGARLTVPIILATGDPPARDPEESAWTAIVAILIKPVQPTMLLSTVASVLRGHRKKTSNAILDSPPLGSASNTDRTVTFDENRDRFRDAGDESRR